MLKWPKERARQRALELLEKVGLAHKADAWPATLSGGQQQRVAIARALAPSPRVLLCDEPTSALDPELSGEVVEVLAQLAREGTTMVIATHDLRLASTIADEAIFLEAGVVVEKGRDLFSRPERERTKRFIATLTQAPIEQAEQRDLAELQRRDAEDARAVDVEAPGRDTCAPSRSRAKTRRQQQIGETGLVLGDIDVDVAGAAGAEGRRAGLSRWPDRPQRAGRP